MRYPHDPHDQRQMTDQAIAVLAGSVFTPEPSPGTIGVLAQGGIIRRLLPNTEAVPADAEVHDLGPEAVLLPGLIDLHTHGVCATRMAPRRRVSSCAGGQSLAVPRCS